MHKLLVSGGVRAAIRTGAMALAAGVLLRGCVELPTAPTVAAMPSPYKPLEVFQGEDQVCRSYAYQQVQAQPNNGGDYYYDSYYGQQYRSNVAYEQCMYSKGNQLPGYTPPAATVLPPR